MPLVGVNHRGFPVGQYHHRARLTDEQVDMIRTMAEEHGRSRRWISMKLRIPYKTIEKICRYERRAQIVIGFKFVKR